MWTREKHAKNSHLKPLGVVVVGLVLFCQWSGMKLSSVLGVGSLAGLPAFAEILERQSNVDLSQK